MKIYEVRIFVESTLRGPARRDGMAMWIVEYMKDGVPVTREGMVYVEKGTEAEANLKALIDAFGILRKTCSILVFPRCEHVLSTLKNQWWIGWKENDWKGAKGKPVKNAELWQKLIEKMEAHGCSMGSGVHEYQNVMLFRLKEEMAAKKAAE